MDRRLFEDLVVSSPPARLRRRAALMPASAAVHAAVVALALLLPVVRPGASPEPVPQVMRWPTTVRAATSPPRGDPAPRPATTARVVPPRVPPVVAATPPPAPGPIVAINDPTTPPAIGDLPSPCLTGCDAVARPGGSGDGPPGGDPAGVTGPADGTGGPIRPGGDIQPPRRVVYVPPAYPEIARQARVGGVVVLDCTIDRDGRVVDVRVISGHPLLDEAAVSAVRKWTYTPTRLNGVPIPVLMTVTVRFNPR